MFIFLDIDGVLIPEKRFTQAVDREDYCKFDPDCLQKFEDVLRRYPHALVVISSSWREIFPFEFVRPLFSPDIVDRVVGFTPFLYKKVTADLEFVRYHEVLEYLHQNNLENSLWVAVDDIREHYPENVSIVVTNAYHGFDQLAAIALELYLQEQN
jgi:hypothetical protein